MKAPHHILLSVLAVFVLAHGPLAQAGEADRAGTHDSGETAMVALLRVLEQTPDCEILADLMRKWAVSDLPSAMEWVATYPMGSERDAMIGQVCLAWAETAPREAATLALNQVGSESIRDEVMAGITRVWGMRSRTEVRAWLEEFPDAPWRFRAMDEVSGILSASKFGGTTYGGAWD